MFIWTPVVQGGVPNRTPPRTSLAKGYGIKDVVQELSYEVKSILMKIDELIMIHEFGSDSPTAIQDKWHREDLQQKVCELGPLAQTLRHEDVHIEFIAYIYPFLKQLPVWDWPTAF